MATHISDSTPSVRDSAAPTAERGSLAFLAPIGRLLFGFIFVFFGLGHFSAGTIGYAASSGVPLASLLVPLSGVMAIAGGVSVIVGYKARLGALLVALFLVPVTFTMHAFWNADAASAMVQQIMFLKNISMLGAALLVIVQGAGPYSLDARRSK